MKNIAIIGYGNMGKNHVQNLKTIPMDFHVSGIVDVDESSLIQAQSDGFYAYRTISELFSTAYVDICLIATPNDCHKELCIQCLNAGKHVICEKPATMHTTDLVDILSVAERNNLIFTVDQNRRWDKDYLAIKKMYDSKRFGSLIYLDSTVQGSHPLPDNWLSKKGIGGMLYDWGVHLVDQILMMIPFHVTSVYTHMVTLPKHECEENVKILLTFSNNEHVQIQADTRCYQKLPRWYVMYENATVVIPEIGQSGFLHRPNGSNAFSREEYVIGSGPSRTLAPSEDIERLPLDQATDCDYTHSFYKNVSDAIDHKAELYVKPEQIIRVAKILELALQSSIEHRSMNCDI